MPPFPGLFKQLQFFYSHVSPSGLIILILQLAKFHTSYLIPHTSYLIPHTSYLIPHTSYLIPHTSYLFPHHFPYSSNYFFRIWFTKIIAIGGIPGAVCLSADCSRSSIKPFIATLVFQHIFIHVCGSTARYILINKNNSAGFF
jgi:hypothetical protein